MISIKSISSITDKGVRDTNEDFIIVPSSSEESLQHIIVLCDGMGGHGHGEIASQTVAEAVVSYLCKVKKEEFTPVDLQYAINYAMECLNVADIAINPLLEGPQPDINPQNLDEGETSYDDDKTPEYKPMGTTIVVVAINKMEILVGHAGDSRCYLYDTNGALKFRTTDHSLVAQAVADGILTEEEARTNSRKNIITRCLMARKTCAELEFNTIKVDDNDMLLLCSDGVVDAMTDIQLGQVLIGQSTDKAVEIIADTCRADSHDNFSAVLALLKQDGTMTTIETIPGEQHNDCIKLKQEAPKICPRCFHTNDCNAKFCSDCGCNLILEPQQGIKNRLVGFKNIVSAIVKPPFKHSFTNHSKKK